MACANGQLAAQAVLNAASYTGALAPGALASIFGGHLAPAALPAGTVPLPNTLDGVSVTVGGQPAPLLYVSPGQINLLIPFEAPVGAKVPLVVTTAEGASPALNIALSRDGPALFTRNNQGAGAAVAFDTSFRPLAAVGADPIILYATGLGPTDPAPASSGAGGASGEPFNRVKDKFDVLIGELHGEILFAGLAPGLPGVYQINVIPPAAPLSNRVYIAQNGVVSNAGTLPIPVGTNVANVSGSIEGMYPATGIFATMAGNRATGGPISFSEMLTAAAISASFDILPNAKPFTIMATGPGGSAVLQIDPVQGSVQGYATSVSTRSRVYDFSGTGLLVYDLQTLQPFPGDIVPSARLDPVAIAAFGYLPLPNHLDPGSPSPNGTVTYQNTLSAASDYSPFHYANGHFTIGDGSGIPIDLQNYGLFFGGFINLGLVPPSTQTAEFLLFIDGMLVASKTVPYQVD